MHFEEDFKAPVQNHGIPLRIISKRDLESFFFFSDETAWTLWPSGLRRWLKAPFRKGEVSNPAAVIFISK